jgi:hypothetical protein
MCIFMLNTIVEPWCFGSSIISSFGKTLGWCIFPNPQIRGERSKKSGNNANQCTSTDVPPEHVVKQQLCEEDLELL